MENEILNNALKWYEENDLNAYINEKNGINLIIFSECSSEYHINVSSEEILYRSELFKKDKK